MHRKFKGAPPHHRTTVCTTAPPHHRAHCNKRSQHCLGVVSTPLERDGAPGSISEVIYYTGVPRKRSGCSTRTDATYILVHPPSAFAPPAAACRGTPACIRGVPCRIQLVQRDRLGTPGCRRRRSTSVVVLGYCPCKVKAGEGVASSSRCRSVPIAKKVAERKLCKQSRVGVPQPSRRDFDALRVVRVLTQRHIPAMVSSEARTLADAEGSRLPRRENTDGVLRPPISVLEQILGGKQ